MRREHSLFPRLVIEGIGRMASRLWAHLKALRSDPLRCATPLLAQKLGCARPLDVCATCVVLARGLDEQLLECLSGLGTVSWFRAWGR